MSGTYLSQSVVAVTSPITPTPEPTPTPKPTQVAVKTTQKKVKQSPELTPERRALIASAGIAASDAEHVNFIFWRESGWNSAAINPGGCAGLGQACPGKKMPCKLDDALCQVKYFDGYAKGRYGSWAMAHSAWNRQNWW